MEKTIIVDGCNLCYSNGKATSRGVYPKIDRIFLAKEFFRTHGFKVLVFISSALKHKLNHRDADFLQKALEKTAFLFETPAGFSDDEFILETAEKFHACILSNDRYQQYQDAYREAIEHRIPFMIVEKQLIIPRRILAKNGVQEGAN
ncbi:MAG: hypothetical protein ACFFB3_11340 [Candidatus Hodarchaeota archaeon]